MREHEPEHAEVRKRLDERPDVAERGVGVVRLEVDDADDAQHAQVVTRYHSLLGLWRTDTRSRSREHDRLTKGQAGDGVSLPRVAPSIDVVVPVHNRWEVTNSCLEHLRQQTLPHTVIVCDNGSTDGTPERVRETLSRGAARRPAHESGLPCSLQRGSESR